MPTKDQPGHSNVDQLEARVKRAANVYNPKQPPQSVSSEHNPEHYPETNQFDNPDIMMEEMSNDLNSKSVVFQRKTGPDVLSYKHIITMHNQDSQSV